VAEALTVRENAPRLGQLNGLIFRHLSPKVTPQETHPIVLKKKMSTIY